MVQTRKQRRALQDVDQNQGAKNARKDKEVRKRKLPVVVAPPLGQNDVPRPKIETQEAIDQDQVRGLLAWSLEREGRYGAYGSWNPDRVTEKRDAAVQLIFKQLGRRFSRQTVHLAVALMDRSSVVSNWFDMCSEIRTRAACFVAVKFEENVVRACSVHALTTPAITKTALLTEEVALLKAVDYDLRLPTITGFLDLAFALMKPSARITGRRPPALVRFLADFALASDDFLSLKPSEIALICIALATSLLDDALLKHFRASKDSLLFPAVNLHRRVREAMLNGNFLFTLYTDLIDWDSAIAEMTSNLKRLHGR